MTSRYVDNAQTPVAKANAIVNKDPDVVRPTVLDYIAHPDQHFAV
jgi:hypothetical protein